MYYSSYCLIQSLYVENLKCFEKITVDLNNDINIISGRGGTGKSSLIEALCLILYWNLYELKENFFSQIRRFNTENTTIVAKISLDFLQEDAKDVWQSKLSPELIKIIKTSINMKSSTVKLIIHVNNTFDYYIDNSKLNHTQYHEWFQLINFVNPLTKETKKNLLFSIEQFFSTELNPEESYNLFIDQLHLTDAILTYNNLDKQLKQVLAEKESFQDKLHESSHLESNLNSQIKMLEEYNALSNQLIVIEQELQYAPLVALENRKEALKNSLKRITADITKTKQLLAEKELEQTQLNEEILRTEKEKNRTTQDYENFRQQYLEKKALQDRSSRKTAEIGKSLTNVQFKIRQTNMKISDTNRLLQELEKNKAILAETEFNQKKQSLLEQQVSLTHELKTLNEQHDVYKQEQKTKLADIQNKDKKSNLLSDEMQKKQKIVDEITTTYEKLLERHDTLHAAIEVLAEKVDAFEEEKTENEKELETLTKNLDKETSKINRKNSQRPATVRAQSTLNNLKITIENKIAKLKDEGINFDAYKQLQEFQNWKKQFAEEESIREQAYLLISQKLDSWKQLWNETLEHQKKQLQNILDFLLTPFKTKISLNLTFVESPEQGFMKNSLIINEQTINPSYLSVSERAMLEYIITLAFAILTGKHLFLDDGLLQKFHVSDINTLLKSISTQNSKKNDARITIPQIIFTYPYIPILSSDMAESFSAINIVELIRA